MRDGVVSGRESTLLRDRARRFPPNQSWWPTFFALVSWKQRLRNLSAMRSPQLVRHNSWRRRIPMPASPRRLARCNRHEARSGIVALISCCLGGLGPLVCLIASVHAAKHLPWCRVSEPPGPAGFQRGQERPQQSTVFFAVLDGTSTSGPEPQFFMRPRELGQRNRVNRKSYHLRSHQFFPLVLHLYRYSIGFPHLWRTIFANWRACCHPPPR